MPELDALIGQRLKKSRKALGFKSARSFARHHGIPESTYSQHETGKRSLNPTTLVSYCEQLKISPGWLISGEEKPVVDINLLASVLETTLFSLVVPNAQSQFKEITALCATSYAQALKTRTATTA